MVSGNTRDHKCPRGFWHQHRTSAWPPITDHRHNTASAKAWAPDIIIALGGSTGHQHGLQDNTGHGQWTLTWRPTWSPTWTPTAAWPVDPNTALGSSIDHKHQYYPVCQHSPWKSTWLQTKAQTIDICMALGDNMGHRHQQEPQLHQDNEPRQGPRQQHGP